jgi:hypothetical protein
MVSGTRFIGKKNTRTMIIKKISPITDPMDPGSGKNHSGSRSRIKGVKSTGSRIRNTV